LCPFTVETFSGGNILNSESSFVLKSYVYALRNKKSGREEYE